MKQKIIFNKIDIQEKKSSEFIHLTDYDDFPMKRNCINLLSSPFAVEEYGLKDTDFHSYNQKILLEKFFNVAVTQENKKQHLLEQIRKETNKEKMYKKKGQTKSSYLPKDLSIKDDFQKMKKLLDKRKKEIERLQKKNENKTEKNEEEKFQTNKLNEKIPSTALKNLDNQEVISFFMQKDKLGLKIKDIKNIVDERKKYKSSRPSTEQIDVKLYRKLFSSQSKERENLKNKDDEQNIKLENKILNESRSTKNVSFSHLEIDSYSQKKNLQNSKSGNLTNIRGSKITAELNLAVPHEMQITETIEGEDKATIEKYDDKENLTAENFSTNLYTYSNNIRPTTSTKSSYKNNVINSNFKFNDKINNRNKSARDKLIPRQFSEYIKGNIKPKSIIGNVSNFGAKIQNFKMSNFSTNIRNRNNSNNGEKLRTDDFLLSTQCATTEPTQPGMNQFFFTETNIDQTHSQKTIIRKSKVKLQENLYNKKDEVMQSNQSLFKVDPNVEEIEKLNTQISSLDNSINNDRFAIAQEQKLQILKNQVNQITEPDYDKIKWNMKTKEVFTRRSLLKGTVKSKFSNLDFKNKKNQYDYIRPKLLDEKVPYVQRTFSNLLKRSKFQMANYLQAKQSKGKVYATTSTKIFHGTHCIFNDAQVTLQENMRSKKMANSSIKDIKKKQNKGWNHDIDSKIKEEIKNEKKDQGLFIYDQAKNGGYHMINYQRIYGVDRSIKRLFKVKD
jgi:hypothetical protein